jgi:hypothetical protein
MTAHIPPMAHEEIDFLDEIERELVALTTAGLVGGKPPPPKTSKAMPTSTLTTNLKTVILAKARTHTT